MVASGAVPQVGGDPPRRGSVERVVSRCCRCGTARRRGRRRAAACPRGPARHAGPVRDRDLHRRDPRLSRAADGRADGPAALRRVAGRLDDLDALLPGGATRRLRLRARVDAPPRSFAPAARARGRARSRGRRASDWPRPRATSRGGIAFAVAARRARDRGRCAVLRGDDREPPASALARDERARRRTRPVLPLRRGKRRQPARVARVSVRRRAAADARPAGTTLVGRLRALRAALPRLPAGHTAGRRCGAVRRHSDDRAVARLENTSALGGHCSRAVEPDARRHDVHLDGRRVVPVAVGAAVGRLSPDLRRQLRAAAARDAGDGGTNPAAADSARLRRHARRGHVAAAGHVARAAAGALLRGRAGTWAPRGGATRARASDGVLLPALARRSARRRTECAGRAARVRLRPRVSARARARPGAAARRPSPGGGRPAGAGGLHGVLRRSPDGAERLGDACGLRGDGPGLPRDRRPSPAAAHARVRVPDAAARGRLGGAPRRAHVLRGLARDRGRR